MEYGLMAVFMLTLLGVIGLGAAYEYGRKLFADLGLDRLFKGTNKKKSMFTLRVYGATLTLIFQLSFVCVYVVAGFDFEYSGVLAYMFACGILSTYFASTVLHIVFGSDGR